MLVNGVKRLGINLSDEVIEKFSIYFHELNRWNSKINLTSLKSEPEIVANLFVDSLAGSLAFDLEKTTSIIDVGSGGGFPGIPLKIAFPHTKMTLVEPKIKKTAFLHHVIGMLSLSDIQVKAQKIEDLVENIEEESLFDYVVAKAISPDDIFPSVHSAIHHKSVVCLYRSQPFGKEQSYFGMELYREIAYDLPFGYGSRVLSLLRPANA